ncbi:hypothetical protein H9N28_06240 [Rhodobacter capsulatus]|nr:hypothetical protein AP073_01135 [Rhodobacter capsulatus]KQB17664.1 hypothetical protein AP071_01140 [Rhodobacter capsulatus]QNR64424.1 hypothetical protein H9N28_06240 [Rhodobacter capsulatus]
MWEQATRLRVLPRFAARRIAGAFMVFGLVGMPPGASRAQDMYLATNPIIVTADRGGYLGKRSDQIDRMRSMGQRVELRGTCLSACTMYLSLPNVCVAPDAVLGFHGPSKNGIPLPQRDFDYWSQVMARNYSEPLRSWFMTKARYITNGYYKVSGAELIRMGYPQC